MRLKYLFNSFSGGQFSQNRLDGNTRAGDYGLAHHHAGIGNNHLSVIAHMSLFKPAYRAACATSSGPVLGSCARAWARDIGELQRKARFMRVSSAGLRESHVHDVIITKEAPNYRVE